MGNKQKSSSNFNPKKRLKLLEQFLEELKKAYEKPRVYLLDYFDDLRKQIYEKCDEHLKQTKNATTVEALSFLTLMIDEIKHFEQTCLLYIPVDRQINDTAYTKHVSDSIHEIDSKLKDIDLNNNDKKIMEVKELIDKTMETVHDKIFLKKGLLFLNKEIINGLISDEVWDCVDKQLVMKTFGLIMVVEDTFINQRKLYKTGKGSNEFSEHFSHQDLKIHLLSGAFLNEQDGNLRTKKFGPIEYYQLNTPDLSDIIKNINQIVSTK